MRIDSAWQVPHSRVTLSRQASVSTRWIECAEWQSAQTGARASPFLSAAAWTPCVVLLLDALVALAARRRDVGAEDLRLAGSVLRLMSWLPWQFTHDGATISPDFSSALP